MATKFYLPASGTSPATPDYTAGWDNTTIASRLPLVRAKTSTALAAVSFDDADDLDKDILYRQFVSEPIHAQAIGGTGETVGISIKCSETDAKNNMFMAAAIKIVDYAGTTVRGTVLAITLDGTEAPLTAAAASRYNSFAISSAVNALEGDRIVVEIGMSGNPANGYSHDSNMTFGDNAAADLDAADADAGADNPWISFSQAITFGVGMSVSDSVVPGEAVTGHIRNLGASTSDNVVGREHTFDNFNRGNANPIGAPWVTFPGRFDLKIVSSQVVSSQLSDTNACACHSGETVADGFIEFKTVNTITDSALTFRCDTTAGTGYCCAYYSGSWRFGRLLSGAVTWLDATNNKADTPSAGDIIRIEFSGSDPVNVKLYRNGTYLTAWNDTTYLYLSGTSGVNIYDYDGDAWDDFKTGAKFIEVVAGAVITTPQPNISDSQIPTETVSAVITPKHASTSESHVPGETVTCALSPIASTSDSQVPTEAVTGALSPIASASDSIVPAEETTGKISEVLASTEESTIPLDTAAALLANLPAVTEDSTIPAEALTGTISEVLASTSDSIVPAESSISELPPTPEISDSTVPAEVVSAVISEVLATTSDSTVPTEATSGELSPIASTSDSTVPEEAVTGVISEVLSVTSDSTVPSDTSAGELSPIASTSDSTVAEEATVGVISEVLVSTSDETIPTELTQATISEVLVSTSDTMVTEESLEWETITGVGETVDAAASTEVVPEDESVAVVSAVLASASSEMVSEEATTAVVSEVLASAVDESSPAETVAGELSPIADVSDSIVPGDTILTQISGIISPFDSIVPEESLTLVVSEVLVETSDSTVPAESTTAQVSVVLASTSDSIVPAEATTGELNPVIDISDSLTPAELTQTVISEVLVSASDETVPLETVAASLPPIVNTSDSIVPAETIAAAVSPAINVSDTIVPAEEITSTTQVGPFISDSQVPSEEAKADVRITINIFDTMPTEEALTELLPVLQASVYDETFERELTALIESAVLASTYDSITPGEYKKLKRERIPGHGAPFIPYPRPYRVRHRYAPTAVARGGRR